MTATVIAPDPGLVPPRRLRLVGDTARVTLITGRAARVVVAHGQQLVCAGIRRLLESGEGIAVVGEAAGGEQAIAVARRVRPDVVLIDTTLPGLDIEGIRKIAALPGVRVMLLTTPGDDTWTIESLRAGATALLAQDTEPSELLRAVRQVARGETLLSPRVTRRLIAELVARPELPRPGTDALAGLTPREREVVALVARGLSNEEIAERLVVSSATAKTHVSHAMVKLDARDRAQLVVLAYQSGLVRPGSEPPSSRLSIAS